LLVAKVLREIKDKKKSSKFVAATLCRLFYSPVGRGRWVNAAINMRHMQQEQHQHEQQQQHAQQQHAQQQHVHQQHVRFEQESQPKAWVVSLKTSFIAFG